VDIPASDHLAHAFPVSVKGVAIQDGKVLLLENERFLSRGRREHWWRPPPGCQRQPL
jgi:DUF1009 family protein